MMESFGWNNSKSCILLLITISCLFLSTFAQNCPRNRLSGYARKRLGRGTINRLCSRTRQWNSCTVKRSRSLSNTALSSKQRRWFKRVCRKANGCGRRRKRQSGFGRYPPVTRKEYRMMSDDERNRFHRAVNALKNSRIDNLSKYEILVVYHTPENSPGAHFGAAFLPFHREMLKYLEVALRIEDPQVSIPYWDSTLDQPLPNPVDSVMWSDQFLGNPRGPVTSGPFAGWRVYDHPRARQMSSSLRLVRNAGGARFGSLYRPADIQQIRNSIRSYSDLSFCINPFFEMVHGAVHIWVGGTMDPLEASANDPVFYMLHSFVDMLWEDFRQSRQTAFQRQNSYATAQQACNRFHFRNAPMRPFNMRNIDGLSNDYTTSFYNYQQRPFCVFRNDRCSSAYLFCHRGLGRCVSKVRPGGNCRGLEQYDSCAYGRCINGRCVSSAVPNQQRTIQQSGTFQTQRRRALQDRSRANVPGFAQGSRNREDFEIADCINNHRCCKLWQSVGECERNPDYLRRACPAACGVCRSSGGSGCIDQSNRCGVWGNRGECQQNAIWMDENCARSCGVCRRPLSELTVLCGARQGSGCTNYDGRCERWSRNGECMKNTWWMGQNCPLACNTCSSR